MLSQTFCCWASNNLLTVIYSSSITHWNARKIIPPNSATVFWFRNEFFNTTTAVWLNFTQDASNYSSLLVCVVINNSSYAAVKNNNTAYHAFRKYWMQTREFLNYRLKYCWPKIIYCICQRNELKRVIKKQLGAKQKSGRSWPTQAP